MCFLVSHVMNCVSEMHLERLKLGQFKELNEELPGRMKSIMSGVSPRRWICCTNVDLCKLLSKNLAGNTDWLCNMDFLHLIQPDPAFYKEFQRIRQSNKQNLAAYIFDKTGFQIDQVESRMFIGNTKRFSAHKQQLLSVLGIVDAHLRNEQKQTMTIFGGKASSEDYYDKSIIQLITRVSKIT